MRTRLFHSKFWKDNFIETLTPIEKLLFIYFLTNQEVNILFCYECSDKRVIYETGCNQQQLDNFKIKVENADKIYFKNGYVCLKNGNKYENFKGNLMEKGKENILKELSKEITDWYDKINKGAYRGIEGGLKGTRDIDIDIDIDNDKDIVIDKELITNKEKEDLIQYLVEKGMNKEFAENEIKKFINYWTEFNHSGTKQRWQLQKTFEVKKRLVTWFNNIREFNKEKKGIIL